MTEQGPIKARTDRGRSRNITSYIFQDLGLAIVTGKYSHDRPFPVEAELCKIYAASRSVVREAVKMLSAKGLLSSVPRQGTCVQPEQYWNLFDSELVQWLLERKFSFALLLEFTQIRLAIEPAAAALAAASADMNDLQAMEAALSRLAAAHRGKDDPLTSDIDFHIAVLRASHNRFYCQLEELIETALRYAIRETNEVLGVEVAEVEEHQAVFDAILRRDPLGAERAMRAIMEKALGLVRQGSVKAAG